ncbi:sulfotransferase family 2 domain-containing protein [Persicobacter psychrovividus]|uniref:Sulfotransferase family protein n=1 Tax=Persicobacter psychrovividus TaxID=387638 RepID=A0ABM7VBE6_9BACT|nr:hypothetical protein PEPS_05310 [Persicobacter psychrovividus]
MTYLKSIAKHAMDARFFWKSVPKRLLFEHVPKCGGTTVVKYLSDQYPFSKTYQLDNHQPMVSIQRFKNMPQKERYSYHFVVGHMAHLLKDDVHPEMLKATILRDPIDRMVSHYYYVLRRPTHYLYEQVKREGVSLKDYVTLELSRELRNNYVHRFSQIEEKQMLSHPREALEKAIEVLTEEYQFVGFLESLEADLLRLKHLMGFSESYVPMKANATAGRKKVEELDPQTLKEVEAMNLLDVALYQKICDQRVIGG